MKRRRENKRARAQKVGGLRKKTDNAGMRGEANILANILRIIPLEPLTLERTTEKENLSGMPKRKKCIENPYLEEVEQLKGTLNAWDDFFLDKKDGTRELDSVRLEVMSNNLLDKYAWAIPDQRALSILSSLAPLVEIGAGKGYWAYLLRNMDIDILTFDKHIDPSKEWTNINKGTPANLKNRECNGRSLFLCYPDEDGSMASKCLDIFVNNPKAGKYVIHVGEMIDTGCMRRGIQNPFGRTTGSDFQVKLSEHFHCILKVFPPLF